MKNITLYILIILTFTGCANEKKITSTVNFINKPEITDEAKINKNISPEDDFCNLDTISIFFDFHQYAKDVDTTYLDHYISKYGINFHNSKGLNFLKMGITGDSNTVVLDFLLSRGFKFETEKNKERTSTFITILSYGLDSFAHSALKNITVLHQEDLITYIRNLGSDVVFLSKIFEKVPKDEIDLVSLLRASVGSCNKVCTEYFLKKGANPNYKFDEDVIEWIGYYDINVAFYLGYGYIGGDCDEESIEILSLLIKYGLDINATDKEGGNMISEITVNSNMKIIEEAIKLGCKVETKNGTSLSGAAFWSRNNILKMLLKNKANPNWNNSSAILFSAFDAPGDGFGEHISKEMKLESVEILLKYGANPKLKSRVYHNQEHVLISFNEYAISNKFNDLIALLDKYDK